MNTINEKDKISIIMGVFNCAETLPDAINSIINQTYENWELIICDDASTDNTYEVANKYAIQYPSKIILIKNETNSKLAYSLNHCLEHATGEYIARMDGDDISRPERLEVQLEYIKQHPEYVVVGCAMQRFNDEGLADIVYSIDNPDYYTLRKSSPFHHATILAKREMYDRLGGYTVCKRTERGQDYDLWFRFYKEGFEGNNLRNPLYLVREDANAIRRRTFKRRREAFQTTKYGFKLLGYPKSWLISAWMEMMIKSMTPYWVIEKYREHQKQNYNKTSGEKMC